MVHDLVQQDGEIEDGEALDERERDPDQRVLEADEAPRRQPEHEELTHGDDPVPPRGFLVQILQLLARKRVRQLGLESHRVLRVIV